MLEAPLLSPHFWAKTTQMGDCLVWTGAKTLDGYGTFGSSHRGGPSRYAHRIVWEALHGPVPAGLELDHLCRNPACVDADHLEPVTHRENVLRGAGLAAENSQRTHCPRGHEYTPENTERDRYNSRYCRECRRIRQRKHSLEAS